MAATQFGTSDPRTQKKWSKDTFAYALKDFFFLEKGFLGTGPGSIIQVVKDLEGSRKKADKLNIELEVPLSGEGQGDGGTVTDSEESLVVMNQEVVIHERAHGVVSQGPLDEKRTATNFRSLGKRQLGTWIRNVCLEPDLDAAMYGLYNASGISTVNEVAPSANRRYFGGQNAAGTPSAAKTTDALLSAETAANYLCGLQILSIIKRKAQMATPKIRPVRINGKGYYVVLLHPYQIKAIRNQTGESSFAAMMKDAWKRGKDNPIFAGAEFYYDGMIVYEYDRAPMRTGADGTTPAEGFTLSGDRTTTTDPVANTKSVARGLLLGCQAGVMVWGMRPKWHEDYVDARKEQIIVDMLYGARKVQFSQYTQPSGGNTAQQDYGVYTFDTQVVVDG